MEFERTVPWKYQGATYAVTLKLEELHGRLKPVAFGIEQKPRPKERKRALTSEALGRIPLQRLVTQALEEIYLISQLAEKPLPPLSPLPNLLTGERPTLDAEFHAKRVQFWAKRKAEAPRVRELIVASGEGNGRRWGPEHYEQVLEVYEQAQHFQQPTTKAVVDAFGLSQDAALKHIQRAKAKVKGATRRKGGK